MVGSFTSEKFIQEGEIPSSCLPPPLPSQLFPPLAHLLVSVTFLLVSKCPCPQVSEHEIKVRSFPCALFAKFAKTQSYTSKTLRLKE